MEDEIGRIDQKEKELSENRKLTEEIAIDLLNKEIRNCLRNNQFDEAGESQTILSVLKKENGMISDLDWEQFKLLKKLWQQELRMLAVKEIRDQETVEERSEKVTMEIETTEEAAKKAAFTEDQIDNEEAGNGAA
ncbi:hypothetical protein ACFL3T_04430 [Patescibacteria group bacterium]